MNSGPFCGSCGTMQKPGALYCGNCGTPAPQEPRSPVGTTPASVGTVGGAMDASPPAPTPMIPVGDPAPFAGYATFGRRVGAYVVDAILATLAAALPYLLLLPAIAHRSSSGLDVALAAMVIGPVAYILVLWAMAAKGSSPGKAVMGIRVVRELGGGQPGAGLGLGRLLLRGLLIGITFYIGGFSPLWDKSGRRKGWWDTACNTVVLDLRAVPAYRAAPPIGAAESAAVAPDPRSPSTPTDPDRPDSWPPDTSDQPWQGAAVRSSHQGHLESSVEVAPNEPLAWDIPPVQAMGQPGRRAASPVSASSWDDRPAGDSWTGAAGKPPPPPPPPPPPVPSPPSGIAGTVPLIAPIQSGVISSVPGARPGEGQRDVDEAPAERTRMRVAPLSGGVPGWYAELDDGRRLLVERALVIGRDPVARDDEPGAVLVPVADDGRSVSKTHLTLTVGPAGIQVTDRHSTNGVTVVTAGVDLQCVPGLATPVPEGSMVRFGDRSLYIRRS